MGSVLCVRCFQAPVTVLKVFRVMEPLRDSFLTWTLYSSVSTVGDSAGMARPGGIGNAVLCSILL